MGGGGTNELEDWEMRDGRDSRELRPTPVSEKKWEGMEGTPPPTMDSGEG